MVPSKSRERKCSTCKHYQPSPLWRKGWCRNPLLYDRNTNHLVEADSLACNRTFIDYWEPLEGQAPAAGPQGRAARPRIAPSIPVDTTDAQGRRGVVTGNTPAPGTTPAVNTPPLPRPLPRREGPALALVKPSDEEDFEPPADSPGSARVTRKIPKIAAPEEDLEPTTARQRIAKARRSQKRPPLPALAALRSLPAIPGLGGNRTLIALGGLVALAILGVLLVPTLLSPDETADLPQGGGIPQASTTAAPTPTGIGDPTPTSAVPPTAVAAPPPPDQLAVNGWAKVNSAQGLIIRAEPSTTGRRLTVLRNGSTVKVVGGPTDAGGYTWWQVQGFSPGDPAATGWCAGQFLTPAPAP